VEGHKRRQRRRALNKVLDFEKTEKHQQIILDEAKVMVKKAKIDKFIWQSVADDYLDEKEKAEAKAVQKQSLKRVKDQFMALYEMEDQAIENGVSSISKKPKVMLSGLSDHGGLNILTFPAPPEASFGSSSAPSGSSSSVSLSSSSSSSASSSAPAPWPPAPQDYYPWLHGAPAASPKMLPLASTKMLPPASTKIKMLPPAAGSHPMDLDGRPGGSGGH